MKRDPLRGVCRGAFLALALCALVASTAHAAWPYRTDWNLGVSPTANAELQPTMCGDGSGGAYVAWSRYTASTDTWDLRVKHVTVAGGLDPAWPPDGTVVGSLGSGSYGGMYKLVPDGAHGLYIAWAGYANMSLYVQRVLATGLPAPGWPLSGSFLGAAWLGFDLAPQTDGTGVTCAYADSVRLTCTRISSAGTNPGGYIIASSTGPRAPRLASDATNGAFLCWSDGLAANTNIRAHHVVNGAPDGGWPAAGVDVCSATSNQTAPQVVRDASTGCVVAWVDGRGGYYFQHVLGTGVVDPAWTVSGTRIGSCSGTACLLVSDAAGGVFAVTDSSITYSWAIAHHMLANGTRDARWPGSGVHVVYAAGTPGAVADGSGGLYLGWFPAPGATQLVAQRLTAAGVPATGWSAAGDTATTGTTTYMAMPALVADAGGLAIAWDSNDHHIYAKRLGATGALPDPRPHITQVRDVPGDQGGYLSLMWTGSAGDDWPLSAVTSYDVWRRIDPMLARTALARGAARTAAGLRLSPGQIRVTPAGASAEYWEFIRALPADHLGSYACTVRTFADSMSGVLPREVFEVDASDTQWNAFYTSPPESAYSVDDLAPATPVSFTGQYAQGVARLHWLPNTESDLFGYRLHRGAPADFVPGDANRIAAPSDTGYTDAAGGPYYYKLAAVDVHGNIGPYAALLPSGTTDVPAGPALVFGIEPPRPNPGEAAQVVVAFTLSRPGAATLELLDVSGRRVSTREVGTLGVGRHELALTRDVKLSPGVYLLRLARAGEVRTARVTLMR